MKKNRHANLLGNRNEVKNNKLPRDGGIGATYSSQPKQQDNRRVSGTSSNKGIPAEIHVSGGSGGQANARTSLALAG